MAITLADKHFREWKEANGLTYVEHYDMVIWLNEVGIETEYHALDHQKTVEAVEEGFRKYNEQKLTYGTN